VARQWGNIARRAAAPAGYWLVLGLITLLGMNAATKVEATRTRLFLVVVIGVAFVAASLLEKLLRRGEPLNSTSDRSEQFEFHATIPPLDFRLFAQIAPQEVRFGMEPVQVPTDSDRFGEA